jgi:hypothetical protein
MKKLVEIRSEYLFLIGYFFLRSRFIYSAEINIDTKDIKNAIMTEYSNPSVPMSGKKVRNTETTSATAAATTTFFESTISNKSNTLSY